ncbi:MAG TPA: DUF551 domain-containing protein [Pyrinomonadaceae bacterium]|jgi:hypothetical protein
MPWIKASELAPAEGERVLIHDGARDRMEVGRYVGGRWLVEGRGGGRPAEVGGVTHWAPLLESEEYDPADD